MNSNRTNTTSTSASNQPSAESISRRAYEIWEQQGRPDGSDLQHWLQAEQELGANSTPQPTSRTQAPEADTRPLQTSRTAASTKRGSATPFASEKPGVGSSRQAAGVSRR